MSYPIVPAGYKILDQIKSLYLGFESDSDVFHAFTDCCDVYIQFPNAITQYCPSFPYFHCAACRAKEPAFTIRTNPLTTIATSVKKPSLSTTCLMCPARKRVTQCVDCNFRMCNQCETQLPCANTWRHEVKGEKHESYFDDVGRCEICSNAADDREKHKKSLLKSFRTDCQNMEPYFVECKACSNEKITTIIVKNHYQETHFRSTRLPSSGIDSSELQDYSERRDPNKQVHRVFSQNALYTCSFCGVCICPTRTCYNSRRFASCGISDNRKMLSTLDQSSSSNDLNHYIPAGSKFQLHYSQTIGICDRCKPNHDIRSQSQIKAVCEGGFCDAACCDDTKQCDFIAFCRVCTKFKCREKHFHLTLNVCKSCVQYCTECGVEDSMDLLWRCGVRNSNPHCSYCVKCKPKMVLFPLSDCTNQDCKLNRCVHHPPLYQQASHLCEECGSNLQTLLCNYARYQFESSISFSLVRLPRSIIHRILAFTDVFNPNLPNFTGLYQTFQIPSSKKFRAPLYAKTKIEKEKAQLANKKRKLSEFETDFSTVNTVHRLMQPSAVLMDWNANLQ
jgi:hypothetical protein